MALTVAQSVATMAFASYGASGITGTAAELTADLNVFLNGGASPLAPAPWEGFFRQYNQAGAQQLAGGDWSVVWGPVVILPPGTVGTDTAANSMYVAYSPSNAMYVVAIAGTDFTSVYDWLEEDFYVDPPLVAWPLSAQDLCQGTVTDPSVAGVSVATCTGITNLKSMTGSSAAGPGAVSLYDFLTSGVPAGTQQSSTLVFTGHSLAGALSPTLAFDYKLNGGGSWGTMRVLALAGPTPGNTAFSNAFVAAFPQAQSDDNKLPWNTNFRNALDIVPHAWDDLSPFQPTATYFPQPTRYHSKWGLLSGTIYAEVLGGIQSAMNAVKKASYTPITYQDVDPGYGHFNATGDWDPQAPSGTIDSLTQLGQWVEWAHHDGYVYNFQLPQLAMFPAKATRAVANEALIARRRLTAQLYLLKTAAHAPEVERPAEPDEAG
jgi:hypothetical protein